MELQFKCDVALDSFQLSTCSQFKLELNLNHGKFFVLGLRLTEKMGLCAKYALYLFFKRGFTARFLTVLD